MSAVMHFLDIFGIAIGTGIVGAGVIYDIWYGPHARAHEIDDGGHLDEWELDR